MKQGWMNKYIGIPYRDKGRDTSGIDCYGLARLVYKEELGIDLPSFDDEYLAHDQNSQSELTARYKEQWQPVDSAQEGDLVVFKIAGFESHIGIAINDKQFLHARSGQDAAVESFDSYNWKNRVSGFFRYTEKASEKPSQARLTAVPHPLKTERITTAIPAGTTVDKVADWIVKEYKIPEEIKSKVTILVNTKVIPKDEWSTTAIQDNDVVDYRAVAGEDGFRVLASFAIAFAAPYLAAGLLGYGVSAAGVIAAGAAGAATFAATTIAVNIAGGLLLNAIAPITQPRTEDPGQSEKAYMVIGGSNNMVPYENIPFVLGKVRFTPPMGSRAYLSYGSDTNSRLSYFNMLLCWGYGPVEIYEDTLKLGEVPISNYDIPAIKHLEGKSTETTSDVAALKAIYNYDTNQVYSGLELTCEGEPINENVTPGPWTEIATTEPVDTLEIALHFPQGCRRIQKTGDNAGRSSGWPVKFRVEAQYSGSLTWENIGLLVVGNNQTITYKVVVDTSGANRIFDFVRQVNGEDVYYKDAFTHHMTFSVAEGTIQQNTSMVVRVRRETGDANETGAPNGGHQYLNTSILNTVTFRRYTGSYSEPVGTKLALTAMRIQSTDQLTGRIEGVNAIVQSRCLDWNGTTWVEAPTNNPASLFRYVLESPANPRRVTDAASKIDLAKLQYWHQYCQTKGFTYNSIAASSKGVLDLLREICAAGRASPAMKDGKWTVTIDEPQTVVVQHFSPHNSWGFEGLKTLPRIPDAFKIRFFDEDQNYQEVETIVYNIGKDASTAELFESISLPGVTKHSQVVDHARWHFAQLKLRPERHTLNSDFEYLVCNRGDRVKVSHDVPMWGLGSGRIKNRISSTIFDIDEQVPFEKGSNYTFRIRSSDKTTLVNNNGTLDRTIKSSFSITGIQRSSNTVTVFCENHSLQVGDYVEIDCSVTAVETSSALITAVTSNSISYVINGSDISTTAATGFVLMNSGYYDRVCFTQSTTEQECNFPDLFLYGELATESQDLIVLSIEPTTNKTARITLIDYGVTADYNIFNDYLTLSSNTVFETQISLPPVISQDAFGSLKPLITQVYSAKEAAERLSPGTWQYMIKVSYSNVGELPYTTESVECQYDFVESVDELNVKSIKVPYGACAISISDITEGKEYKVRLRYISSKGIVGPWTTWTTHTAAGFTQNQAHTLSLEVDRVRRYLNITPYVSEGYLPEDFNTYEIRVFKDQGTGDFWDSTDPTIKTIYTTGTANINLRDFASPRLSLSGIKYRIACRMLNNSSNYSSSSALSDVVLTSLI